MKRITIGRALDCNIVIPDERDNVSRHHMVLTFSLTGKITASDTSSNGTFVNGKRLQKGVAVNVTKNDKIVLGNSWELDWNTVRDPYAGTRKALCGGAAALAVLLLGGGIYHWTSKTGQEEPTNNISRVVEKADSGTWNKDSTQKVAPTEMRIDVAHAATTKKQKTAASTKKKKNAKAETKARKQSTQTNYDWYADSAAVD